MENVIFSTHDDECKAVMLTEDEFFISTLPYNDVADFKKDASKTGMLKVAHSHKLSFIREIAFKDASDTVKIKYYDQKKQTQKSVKLEFKSKLTANQFGRFLGHKIDFVPTEAEENQTKRLLINLGYAAIAIAGTVFLASLEGEDLSSNGKRGKGAILKVIVETLGQTGVYIIGALITLFLLYRAVMRWQNPATEVVYKKKK